MGNNDTEELHTLSRSVFASLSESVLIYDLQGNIVQMNSAAQQLFEVQPEAFVGISWCQFLASLKPYELEHPEDGSKPQSIIGCDRDDILPQTNSNGTSLCTPSGHELQIHLASAPVYNRQGKLIGGYTICHDLTAHHQQEARTLQAFTSLLTLVEQLVAIACREETGIDKETCAISPILVTGKLLVEIIAKVLNCHYVDVFAIDPQGDRQHLLGASNLTPEQEQRLREETEQAPLSDYIDEATIAQLHANQVVLLDLQQQPYVTPRSDFGARYRLLALWYSMES
ncbi:PAS domain-containing protein [Ktedonospora formicarum]|uniref:PAS domain-containing protein n=1 Tax=Ktedonospora formicarum TaxID=2778364 RepID=A0A8J3IES2_9CHLR|nr:PAS domain-containing protein [Ktedonospora formicarum]GHO51033.1 hypothetical protein KSX_91960 [Ktedonospora formicarum]